jgi:hypothetical protein
MEELARYAEAGIPILLEPKEAGELVGHTENWMKVKARHRLIPHKRPSRKIMFGLDDLNEIAIMFQQRPVHATPSLSAPPHARGQQPTTGDVPVLRAKPPKRRRAA